MDNKTKVVMELSDRILKIIDEKVFREVSRGNLQGIIEAVIMTAYAEGKQEGGRCTCHEDGEDKCNVHGV